MPVETFTLQAHALGRDAKVDRDARIIYGFQVMRAGHVKGRGYDIDQTTLDQLVQAAQKLEHGARGHLGHDSPIGPDPLMAYLGRSKNFRRDGDVVRADFHFASVTMPAVQGGADAIMALAEDDPDAFGASVVVRGSIEEDNEGRKLRIGSLGAVDWVGEPAATSGVFSAAAVESIPPAATDKPEDVQTVISEEVERLRRFNPDADAAAAVVSLCKRDPAWDEYFAREGSIKT